MERVFSKTITELLVTDGQRTGWPIPCVPEGRLTRVVARQVAGAATEFTLGIFESEQVLPGEGSSSEGAPAPDSERERYRVCPAMTSTDGVAQMFDARGHPFANKDGSIANRPRFLYGVIEPVGAGDATFEISLTGVEDS